jgi:hypothetical protein
MSRVRWPALFTDFALAQKWKERAEVMIHTALLQTARTPRIQKNEKRMGDLSGYSGQNSHDHTVYQNAA